MRISVAALLVLTVSAVPAWPQDVFVALCRTHFTVTDAHGQIVSTLGPDDVTVYDNDVPQRFSEFGTHPEAPVDVALLIDRSASIGGQLPELVSAAEGLRHQSLSRAGDRAMVVAFDSKVYVLQDWTGDALSGPNLLPLRAAGGTSLFDALFKSCRDKFIGNDARHNVVVLVTDGEDTTSVATLDQALEMITLSRVTVHAIVAHGEPSLNAGELKSEHVLETLTTLTGGRTLPSEDVRGAALPALFSRLQEEARHTYSAAYYRTQPSDGTFHHIRIVPRDRTLVVHAPTGYYARVLANP